MLLGLLQIIIIDLVFTGSILIADEFKKEELF